MQRAWIQQFADGCVPADCAPLPTSATSDGFDCINTETRLLDNGARVRVEKIPSTIFGKVEVFYVCANCGKIYWEGGHYEKVHEKFSYVLSATSSN